MPIHTFARTPTTSELLLRAIHAYWAANHFSPSIRELLGSLPVKSTSVVQYNLKKLEQQGSITRVPGINRSIVITEQGAQRLRLAESIATRRGGMPPDQRGGTK